MLLSLPVVRACCRLESASTCLSPVAEEWPEAAPAPRQSPAATECSMTSRRTETIPVAGGQAHRVNPDSSHATCANTCNTRASQEQAAHPRLPIRALMHANPCAARCASSTVALAGAPTRLALCVHLKNMLASGKAEAASLCSCEDTADAPGTGKMVLQAFQLGIDAGNEQPSRFSSRAKTKATKQSDGTVFLHNDRCRSKTRDSRR